MVPTVAKQLGLHESQLYSWRSKARLAQDRSAVEELITPAIKQLNRSGGRHDNHRKNSKLTE
jgi:transposase-like protein